MFLVNQIDTLVLLKFLSKVITFSSKTYNISRVFLSKVQATICMSI